MIDSPPFDRSIERGIAPRQRASMSEKTSIENSVAQAALLHERRHGRVAEEEAELLGIVGAVDVPRAEALARLHEQRVARVGGHLVGLPASRRRDAGVEEEAMRLELVGHARADVPVGEQDDGGLERLARAGEQRVVEVVQRHDQPDVVLADEPDQRVQVPGIGDERDHFAPVGVVERGRERIGVHGERDRAAARNARTMSTRWPAQVKRTTVTAAESIPGTWR